MKIIHANMKGNKTVFIGLGSNLGDRVDYLSRAIAEIEFFSSVIKKSSVYETDPVGYKDQGKFLNMVIEIETSVSPEQLIEKLKAIEKRFGRKRGGIRFGPREIDLDVLFYGDAMVNEKNIEIPHPRMHERGFVLDPLNEINPFFIHPKFNKTIHQLWTQLKLKN